MDREKLLKKWKIITILEWIMLCCWDFITRCLVAFKPEFAYNFVNLFMWFVLLCILFIIFEKIRPEKRKIMPMVISIHDTVDKLKKQRIYFLGIGTAIVVASTILQPLNKNIFLMAIESLWAFFMCLSAFTKDKIDYLKEKPEGL